MFGILTRLVDWNLMGAPESFHLFAVDLLGTGPAFGTAQDDERPAWRLCLGVVAADPARLLLNRMDLIRHLVENRGHASMHWGRLRPGDYERFIAVAPKKLGNFVIGQPAENGGIGDLVTTEVQDGQHGSICSWI